jgi:hypothetical protein
VITNEELNKKLDRMFPNEQLSEDMYRKCIYIIKELYNSLTDEEKK